MSFVESSLLSNLDMISRDQANAVNYGVVKVDDAGVIQMYNRWESEMAGFSPATTEGKNFFTQIAVCTNNRLFFGRFKDGVAKGDLDVEFNYTFTYKMRPTNVGIRLYRHKPSRTNWVFVTKK
jgi:photoactive yellow protein